MHRRAGGQREIVHRNLRHVVGPAMSEAQLDRLVRKAFVSYGQYWAESAILGDGRRCAGRVNFSADGVEYLDAAKRAGKGAILALPHLGAWEVGAYWAAKHGYALTTVAEPLDPPELFEWFVRQREELGLQVFPLGPNVTRSLLGAVRHGEFIALLADRDLAGDGIEVEFFGEKTRIPGGPAALALRSGAPLHVCAVYMLPGGGHRIVIRPPLDTSRRGRLRDDLARITAEVASELELLIAKAPEQWHVFQPNWPSDLADGSGAYVAADVDGDPVRADPDPRDRGEADDGSAPVDGTA